MNDDEKNIYILCYIVVINVKLQKKFPPELRFIFLPFLSLSLLSLTFDHLVKVEEENQGMTLKIG